LFAEKEPSGSYERRIETDSLVDEGDKKLKGKKRIKEEAGLTFQQTCFF
jgi:hypothetical protein